MTDCFERTRMKNYHSLLLGFMKLDGWPPSGLTDRYSGQTSLAQLPVPPSTGHKCHVISEESSHEVEVDNINEMTVENKRLDSGHLIHVDNAETQTKDQVSVEFMMEDRISMFNKNELLRGHICPSNDCHVHNFNCNRVQSHWKRDSSEIKSGLLVLIQSHNFAWDNAGSFTVRSSRCDKTSPCSRCPVHVQIHQKSFERYAIITRAGRQPPNPCLYLKLKKSRATLSNTNPCQFVVTMDGSEGQSCSLEASNRQSAEEWVKAFTAQVHNFPLKTTKRPDIFNGLEILPESPVETEEPMTVKNECMTSRSPKRQLTRQNSLTSPRSSSGMPTLSESLDENDF